MYLLRTAYYVDLIPNPKCPNPNNLCVLCASAVSNSVRQSAIHSRKRGPYPKSKIQNRHVPKEDTSVKNRTRILIAMLLTLLMGVLASACGGTEPTPTAIQPTPTTA